MRVYERKYANWVIKLFSLFFLVLYVYYSHSLFPTNYIWFVISIILAIYGFYRKPADALLVSLYVIVIYSCLTLYTLYAGSSVVALRWNDLIWLFIFPFSSLIGSLDNGGIISTQRAKKPIIEDDPTINQTGIEQQQMITIAEGMGFLDYLSFKAKLEDEVERGLNHKRTFTLLLIEIHYFRDFKAEYGVELSEYLLNEVAELIHTVLRDVNMKAYISEGRFAIILPGLESITSSTAEFWLTEKFNSKILTNSRNDGPIKVRLEFGRADFPGHGLDANAILEQAKWHLDPHKEVN